MAKLTLNFNISENSEYKVSVESKSETGVETRTEKTVDFARKNISFDVSDGEYKVYIEQCFEPEANGAIITVLRLITLPVRGILNTIFMNNDTDWEKNLCVYGLKALLNIHVSGDMEYEIRIKDSEFSAETESFSFPTVEASPSVLMKIEKTDNRGDIDSCSRSFIWRMYSVVSVILLLFGVILITSFVRKETNMTVVALLGGIVIVLFLGMVWMNIRNERKRKYLHHLFDLNNK